MTICRTHSTLSRKSLDIFLMLLFWPVAPLLPNTHYRHGVTSYGAFSWTLRTCLLPIERRPSRPERGRLTPFLIQDPKHAVSGFALIETPVIEPPGNGLDGFRAQPVRQSFQVQSPPGVPGTVMLQACGDGLEGFRVESFTAMSQGVKLRGTFLRLIYC
jgi:hypothetical protein